jgi:uncharacterized membrane protein YuzA (DUF378 family)
MQNVITLIMMLASIGAINWGLIGLLDFNLVSYLLNGYDTLQRAIYVVIGVSGAALAVVTLTGVN